MKSIIGITTLQRLAQCLLVGSLLTFAGPSLATERVTYYHNDALGSPVAATDASGTLLWREEYAPYGDRLKKEAGSKDTVWYTGKQEESTFGLNYFGARWYDPKVGRFMGVDPAGFNEDNIHSYSKYAYANNNPYLFLDPDGRESRAALFEQLGMKDPSAGVANAASQVGNRMDSIGDVIDSAATDPVNYAPGGIFLGNIKRVANILQARRGMSALLKAGRQPDRNGLTVAGRALQKHGDRSGSVFPASTGTASARNQQGQNILEGILKSDNQALKSNRFGGNDIFDNNSGRGVRFDGDGNMKGFLEP